MDIKEELLYDFSAKMPRVMVGGRLTVVDNVKSLVAFTGGQIILFNGSKYISVEGENLELKEINDERVLIAGETERICFFEKL